MTNFETEKSLKISAGLVQTADVLIITVDAGISIDSGCPDFSSPGEFWEAYPQWKREDWTSKIWQYGTGLTPIRNLLGDFMTRDMIYTRAQSRN